MSLQARFKAGLSGFKGAPLDFAGPCANMGSITVEGMMKSSKASSYAATMLMSAVLATGMLGAAPAALAQDATTHQVYEAAAAGKFIEAQKMMDQVLADHPNSGKAHFIEAELLAKQGKMARAATELATAERLAPGLKFAKPEAVQHLRSAIASGSAASAANTAGTSIDFSRAPRLNNAAQESPRLTAPAPAPVEQARGIPWGMILGIGVLVVLAAMFFRRKAGPAGGNAGYSYGGGGGGGVPVNYPQYPNGGVPPQPMPPQYGAPGGFGSGGGLGSGIVGGLATGAALGAGLVAGEALAHRFTDSNRGGNEGGSAGANRLGNNFSDTPSAPYEAPPANYDMGGNDFGVDDSGGWDSSGGDSGGGGSDWD